MSRLIPSDFCSYEFESEQEERQAKILTEGNIQSIKNKLALAMSERATLEYDTASPITTFVQREAALMGEIRSYKLLLDEHNEVIESLRALDTPQRG